MLFSDVQDVIRVMSAKPFEEGEFQRIKPELGRAILALNVDVRRLEPVGHVEEEPESLFTQYRGHGAIVIFLAGIASR